MVTGLARTGPVKILAVEDNPAMLEFYVDFFTDMGFEVKTAEDAVTALSVHQQFRADLIVLDLGIPAGGGMLVFETLRTKLKDTVPVIFSTGKPELLPHSVKSLYNVAVVCKPTPPPALLAEVRRLLPQVFEKPQTPVPPPPPPPELVARTVKKLLVVDDDPAILSLYKEILSNAGFDVHTAEDAIGAVTVFQDLKPALVILDVDMPAGGGRKVFERLRLQLASPAPIIFSTASPASVADLEKNASVLVLKKPVTPGILLGAVKDMLKLS